MGTTAEAKARLSFKGLPESLSTSGSMPDTLHKPPANRAVGSGTPKPRWAAVP